MGMCVHAICFAEERWQYSWMEQAWTSGWLDRAGDGCSWCVWAPTSLGSSLTLDGSKARDDGGAGGRTGAPADKTFPFVHGGGGLHRELVLEICSRERQIHAYALDSSRKKSHTIYHLPSGPRDKAPLPTKLSSPGKCYFRTVFFSHRVWKGKWMKTMEKLSPN